jgi:hypothetical protein
LFGWDIGSSSSVVRIIGQGTSEFGQIDAFQLGLLASMSLFGAMGVSAAIIAIGDRFIGRKTELLLAASIYGAGSLLEAVAPTFGTELAGRAIYGIGIGTAMHVAPLYIAESVPSSLRGTLVSLKEAAIVLGIVAGYAVGAAFGEAGGWREVRTCTHTDKHTRTHARTYTHTHTHARTHTHTHTHTHKHTHTHTHTHTHSGEYKPMPPRVILLLYFAAIDAAATGMARVACRVRVCVRARVCVWGGMAGGRCMGRRCRLRG